MASYIQRAQNLFTSATNEPAKRKQAALVVGAFSLVVAAAIYKWAQGNQKDASKSKYKEIPTQKSRGLMTLLNGTWRDHILPDMDSGTKEFGDIYQVGSKRTLLTVVVNNPELIKDIVRQQHSFGPNGASAIESLMPGSLQNSDQRLWAKRRKALIYGLRVCRLETLIPPFLNAFNVAVTNGSVSEGTKQYTKLLKEFTFSSFSVVALGEAVELEEFPEHFKTWSNELIWRLVLQHPFLYKFPCPRYWRFLKADGYMRGRIEESQRLHAENNSNANCVLSRVLEYSESRETEEEKLDEQEVFDLLLLIFLAGYDTTANSIGWVLYLLASNMEKQEELYRQLVEHGLSSPEDDLSSDVLERVVRDCKYLEYVTSEGMRHYPVGLGTAKQALEDVEIGPYLIPKGTNVLGNTWSSRFDAKIWGNEIDPVQFVPERWANLDKDLVTRTSFFPFGVGPRDCPGQRFAVLEMRIVVALFLHRFVIKPVTNKDMKPYLGSVITSKAGYWFDLQKRV